MCLRKRSIPTTSADDPSSLGNLVLQDGLCSPEQLKQALQEVQDAHDTRLGEVLVRHGIVSPFVLAKLLERQRAHRAPSRERTRRVVQLVVEHTQALSASLRDVHDLTYQARAASVLPCPCRVVVG